MRFKMSGIEFGKTKEGNTVTKYLLKNKNGMEVAVMDLGATIVSVFVPDKNGLKRDVVLGYDTPQEYQEHTCYFGAVIGMQTGSAERKLFWMTGSIRLKKMTMETTCTVEKMVLIQSSGMWNSRKKMRLHFLI